MTARLGQRLRIPKRNPEPYPEGHGGPLCPKKSLLYYSHRPVLPKSISNRFSHYLCRMEITYYGHSCFLLEVVGNGKTYKLLFDPFITGNPLAEAQKLSPAALIAQKPDYIILSHAHGDHSGDAEAISKDTGAPIVGVWEIHDYYNKRGCVTVGMNVGGTLYIPDKESPDLWVKLVPAIHTSSFPDGTYGGVPVGFIISDHNRLLYYAGDTSLTLEMELIAERYQLDLAILPIGGHFTMDVEDAVEAGLLLDVSHVMGVHYDTFPPIKIDHEKAKKAFEEVGIRLHLVEVGGKLGVPKESAPAAE